MKINVSPRRAAVESIGLIFVGACIVIPMALVEAGYMSLPGKMAINDLRLWIGLTISSTFIGWSVFDIALITKRHFIRREYKKYMAYPMQITPALVRLLFSIVVLIAVLYLYM